MNRNEHILACIDRRMKILEVGPSYSPIVTRNEGWNVYSLDHSTADELRQKYAKHANVDISRIQEVDFVWADGPIDTAINPEHVGTFDACIGSHLIEHVPDLIAFFQSMERILSPDGVVSLVVPDKRFCFDFFQPVTLSGDVLEAHRGRRTRHSRVAEFNAAAYMVRSGDMIAWGQQATDVLSFYDGDLRGAGTRMFRDAADNEYRDVHGWYFTYSSFRLIMLELAWMGHLNFVEVESRSTVGCEFFITLCRGNLRLAPEEFEIQRMDLLSNMLLEVREQADFLVAGRHHVGPAKSLRA